jgi:heme exporter protein D
MNWADPHAAFVAPAYVITLAVFVALAVRAALRLWRTK